MQTLLWTRSLLLPILQTETFRSCFHSLVLQTWPTLPISVWRVSETICTGTFAKQPWASKNERKKKKDWKRRPINQPAKQGWGQLTGLNPIVTERGEGGGRRGQKKMGHVEDQDYSDENHVGCIYKYIIFMKNRDRTEIINVHCRKDRQRKSPHWMRFSNMLLKRYDDLSAVHGNSYNHRWGFWLSFPEIWSIKESVTKQDMIWSDSTIENRRSPTPWSIFWGLRCQTVQHGLACNSPPQFL